MSEASESKVHRYPHMLYFASLTELLHSIETVDLGLQSLRMQALILETHTVSTGQTGFVSLSLLRNVELRLL